MGIYKEMLEKHLKEGKVERTEVIGLKGGEGRVDIYKDKAKHKDSRIWESGNLLLSRGAIIGMHTHDDDSETLTILDGKVEINGKEYMPGEVFYCNRGEYHDCKNLADSESIVGFVKRK